MADSESSNKKLFSIVNIVLGCVFENKRKCLEHLTQKAFCIVFCFLFAAAISATFIALASPHDSEK